MLDYLNKINQRDVFIVYEAIGYISATKTKLGEALSFQLRDLAVKMQRMVNIDNEEFIKQSIEYNKEHK